MAMTKAEMDSHRTEYYALISNARSAEEQNRYSEAIELAKFSWEHSDGMMQYERKYDQSEFISLDAFEIVLNLAPLLFDFESLNKMEEFLKSQRRIERRISDDLPDRLSK